MDYENGNSLGLIAEKIKNIAQCKYVIISCGKDGLFVYRNSNGVIITNSSNNLLHIISSLFTFFLLFFEVK